MNRNCSFRIRGVEYSARFLILVSLLVVGILGACTKDSETPQGPVRPGPGSTVFDYNPEEDTVIIPGAFVLGAKSTSGAVDANAEYVISVYHGKYPETLVPMAGVPVLLEWHRSWWDHRRYCAPVVPVPNSDMSFVNQNNGWFTLFAHTGSDGKARFRLAGAFACSVPTWNCSNGECPDSPGGPYPFPKQGRVWVDGQQIAGNGSIGSVPGFLFATVDLDGANGVNGSDYSKFLNDYNCYTGPGHVYNMRSDFNGDEEINSGDFNKILQCQFSGQSIVSCPPPGE